MDKESHHIYNLKRGDITSFEYLYNCWSGKLYNFVMRISQGDTYLAEEIVQSVFIKVWEGRDQVDADKSFGAYICTIAKNQLVNIYQHRMLEQLYQAKIKTSEPIENTTEKEVDYHLLEIFVLSRRKLLTNKEIAAKLNLSENTVESQLTKAIAFLRTKIDRHYNISIPLLLFLFID